MNHIEVLSKLLSSDQTILHVAFNEERLDKYNNFTNYKTAGIEDKSDVKIDFNSDFDLEKISGFDTIVVSAGLEIIEQPASFIEKIKNLSETVCIYEYKYDLMPNTDPAWKQHWKTIGLAFTLQRHFDLVNEIFMAESTLHTCKIPHNPRPSDLSENPNAIR